MASKYNSAVQLTSDTLKADYNESNYWQITPSMFTKINQKIPGKNGNWRTLLLYFIFQKQNDPTFKPAEETICTACGFNSASRYHEARDGLEALGLITHIPYKEICINYKKIME